MLGKKRSGRHGPQLERQFDIADKVIDENREVLARLADTPEEERILNFITMAVESLETATMLVRARQSSMHVVSGILGHAAISAACCLLRLHGIAITSNREPHGGMCDRIADLERTGITPEGAAATLRDIESRFHEFGETHERQVHELLPLTRRLADRIERLNPAGGRISLAVQDLAAAMTVQELRQKTAAHSITRKKAKHG